MALSTGSAEQQKPDSALIPNSESKSMTESQQTPRGKSSTVVDSRTITRPSKPRVQQLAEAAVTPLARGDAASLNESFHDSNAQAVVRTVNQSSEAIVMNESKSPMTTLPTSSAAASAQPTATGAVSTPILREALKQERRDEKKGHRTRQRTITLQSQISLDIAAAFKEVKQMAVDDLLGEAERRIHALVTAREKDWAAKNEKLAQLLVYEQRRNEPLEQKAAERLLAIGEYEKLVKEFVEELKRKHEKNTPAGGNEVISAGRPGPERILSADDVSALIKHRDQLAEEVSSLETSYGDLFRRYEKLRQTCLEIRQNEESVKNASEEMAKRYAILAERFEMLRKNAEEQLDLANNEIDRLIKQHETDTLGLRLKVKQLESKNESLIISLEAKKKEVENMTVLFEEVINKAQAEDDDTSLN